MVIAAVGQLTAGANLARNGLAAKRLIIRAAEAGARTLFLPEASDYIAGSPAESVALARPVDESPFIAEIRGALKGLEHPLFVSVGVHEPTEPPGSRVRNTLLWVGPDGAILGRYQKRHLFDVDVPNGPILRESQSVEPGPGTEDPIQSPVGKLGLAICYDIRFPEMAQELRTRGAQILLFPSAFTVRTGEAHWHVLNRARAVDNQCYVISAAQVGQHDDKGKRFSYGHSLVVDPWGSIIAESFSQEEDLITADIDLSKLETIRQNMPLWEQRKNLEEA